MTMPVHHLRLVLIFGFILSGLFMPLTAITQDVYTFTEEGGATYFTNTPGPGRTKVRLPLLKKRSQIKKDRSRYAALHNRKDYEPAITEASRLYAVDPDLVKAVIKAESNYNSRAVSHKGASGLMQLMPGTARDMNVTDPFDPVANIHGGVRYLSQLLDVLKGDLPLALAAYNAGPARVIGSNRIPAIRETRNYVEKVLNYYQDLKDNMRNRI
jgi:soluble lytic murein transglycosylase-like protein